MTTSLNGWPVLTGYSDSRLANGLIPGCPSRRLYCRNVALPLFLALAADYHRLIARLDRGKWDEYSFDRRQAEAASGWSDHASGTAIDLNSAVEGAVGEQNYNWWAGTRAARARRLKERYRVVIWGGATELGGDYGRGYWDWMHWAIRPGVTQAQIEDVIDDLNISASGVRPIQPGEEQIIVSGVPDGIRPRVHGVYYYTPNGRTPGNQ